MTEFRYQAVDAKGQLAQGKLEAHTLTAARELLRTRSLLPMSVEPVASPIEAAPTSFSLRFGSQLGAKVLSQVTRQLASLVANDIRVEDALGAIARQGLARPVAAKLQAVRKQITEGRSLAEALGSQANTFPKPYVAAIAAGEASGRLDVVLNYLSRHTSASWSTRQAIQLAMIYPAFLALVSTLIISLLLTNVVPDIMAVYLRRGTELPLATEILIGLSNAVRQWGLLALISTVAGALAFRWFASTPNGKEKIARTSLRTPMVGAFLARRHSAQVSSTLAMLVQSGVPLVRALRISAEVTPNVHIRNVMLKAAGDVGDGVPLDTALARTGFIPPMMLSMVSGAVRSGQLGDTLDWAARDEQAELDQTVKALSSLLEPIILLVMGGVILFIVLAILTPITRLNSLTGI